MRLTIKGKIAFGFTVVFVLGLGGLGLSIHNSNNIIRDTLAIISRELPGTALIINADRDAYQSNLAISQILTNIDMTLDKGEPVQRSRIDEAVETIRENNEQVRDRFDAFLELFPDSAGDADFARAVDAFNTHNSAWSDITDRLLIHIDDADRSGYESAWRIYRGGEYTDVFSPMRGSLDDLTEWVETEALKRLETARVNVNRSSINSIIVALSVTLGMIIVGSLLSRTIVKPLSELHDALRDIAGGEGDLTQKLHGTGRDEVSRVARAFNAFVDTLALIIADIQMETQNLDSVRRTIFQSVESSGEANSFVDTVAGRMHELSRVLTGELENFTESVESIETKVKSFDEQVQDQASMVEESTAAVQQMIASVSNVTRVSESSGRASRNLLESAGAGRDRVSESVEAVESINMRVGTVMEMIGIIKGIAGTTNLLAMNAAIEAAHAGDSGRGFAVVADEIRKLAENTSEQSRNIADTLGTIVNDVHQAVEISSASQRGYEEIFSTIEDVGNAFEEIVSNMAELETGSRQVLDAMTSLRSSSSAVRDGSGQIKEETARLTTGIASIKHDSGETAAAAADLKVKQGRMSELLAAMTSAAGELEASSSQLVRKIDHFTIES